ncbi:hypothetical protein IW140_000200 [Coemansia sp. RSA 1813]|nr:hypothetical protein EV178_000403 [Coemansia sp. RSA 1646]KAJ1773826.1 hypothetical protein LPJ74_000370 [Coemansia sp. RSA 1843]KAJ2093790.1 hypothetical protein IW138_000186 [Coemansia sp. RSA 986]KAJ2218000.1 hypothetical protein EV179_000145 [Coemansia sp. RSA 487]KAJ2573157.1 hypothetical protein IW140_000200 [Coemansia sp. RSA 1813]
MDTNWCTFCGKHIDGVDEAMLYCSESCRHSDASSASVAVASPSPSTEYFSFRAPSSSSSRASPTGSPVWSPQHVPLRDRSPSLTPMGALDLSARIPCHAPAYSPTSRSSSTMLFPSPPLGPSALDARGRSTSLPYSHQLAAM